LFIAVSEILGKAIVATW